MSLSSVPARMEGSASITVTFMPSFVSASAISSPMRPAPIMMAGFPF